MAAPLAPPRVAFISSHALGGGSERYLELLLGGLDRAWIGGVICLQEGPLVDRLQRLGYDVDVVPTPARLGMLPAARRLRRVLRRQRPSLVHANGIKAALLAVMATVGTGIPVLWLKHDYSWDGWLARLIAVRCRRVVAVARAVTTTFGRRLGSRVYVVPNGMPEPDVDHRAARARVLAALGCTDDARIVVLVGRLHPAKGQIELIEAAPRVLERRPDVRLGLLGGEDPYQPAYAEGVRRRVQELGLGHSVTFLGHRDDPLDIVAGSDATVAPSVPDERGAGKEACPFAVLEALWLGTPVVAYADGGLPELLGDCGELVSPGDRTALSDAVVGVVGDRERRERMSACGRERVRRHNNIDAMVASMMDHYRAVSGLGAP